MKNIKVKGVADENGVTNFMITNTDTGETHIALRNGRLFEVGEFRGTLKQCKELVAASKVVHFADAPPEPESNHSSWDCVHPCALLILIAECDVDIKEIHRTLDAFGWITPEGKRDIKGAEENYEKWRKR